MSEFDISVSPSTIGELRQRLEAIGNPWSVPSRFSDDDPLPDPPRGGQTIETGQVPGIRAVEADDDFEAILREVPPSNPFLIERWREVGALSTEDALPDGTEEWGVG
jgi:hypothetical protein